MTEVVIDTNVLLTASQRHQAVSPDCIWACVNRLQKIRKDERVVLDDGFRILSEYMNKLDARHGKGAGEAFLKWLLQNRANPRRVQQVTLTERAADDYEEFPDPALAAEFDPPDRKFLAVAHCHPGKPPVLQATDSKWLRWHAQLEQHGVRVEFLCRKDLLRFFKAKFPDQPVPPLA